MKRIEMTRLASLFALTVCAFAPAASAQAPVEDMALNFTRTDFDYASSDEHIDAYYDRASCTLWVDGDDAHNFIRVSIDDAGNIVVNDGEVTIYGGQPTSDNTCYIAVDGGAGNDILIANTGGDRAELFGGSGMNVMLWDDADEVDLRHSFDPRGVERQFDLYLVNAPVETSGDDVFVDGKIITAEDYSSAAVAYFDGRFLSARDLGSETDYHTDGAIIIGEVDGPAGDDVFVDGKIITGNDRAYDVGVDGKLIAADAYGYTALSMKLGRDGERIIELTSFE